MDAAQRKLEPTLGSDVADAIIPLYRLTLADLDIAGVKGAALGELIGTGFPVPSGFVVEASAYASFYEEPGLREEIATAYRDLGEGDQVAVAVRSSAAAEESAERGAFEHPGETFLNVRGEAEVVERIRRCWAASPAAGPAVIVQRQVDAVRAGTVLTVDLASSAGDCLVIEGAFGLGEAVVSGSVVPDRYLVDKKTLELAAREVHAKELMVKPRRSGGTVTRRLPPVQASLPVLGREEIESIAELGKRLERHFGSPQRAGWAIDARERLWLLGSRSVGLV